MVENPPKKMRSQLDDSTFHIEFLRSELVSRKKKNARYSLRAFSRSLRMDPAALSRILNGKQELSPKACPQILRAIKAAPADCEMFIASVLAEKDTAEFNSIVAKLRIPEVASPIHKLLVRRIRIDARKLTEAQNRLEKFLTELEAECAVEVDRDACAVSARNRPSVEIKFTGHLLPSSVFHAFPRRPL